MRLVVTDRPQKANPRRVRITVGGDRLDYPFDISTRTAGLSTAKILFNSVVSTPNAKFCTMDIKDFYLNTPMERYEYMRIPVDIIPDDIFEFYKLAELVHNGSVTVEIRKSMYGISSAGRLSSDYLKPHLQQWGYHECPRTPGLFKHETRPILFVLVVDDFGVQYVGQENAEHLHNCIKAKYKCTFDETGDLFCGITLKWNYRHRWVDLSMPGYVKKNLSRFNHIAPLHPQNSPTSIHSHQLQHQTTNGRTDDSPKLGKDDITLLQQIIGVYLYYARAIDSTLLVTLSDLSAQQTQATELTMQKANQMLDYLYTNSDFTLRFYASDMQLAIESDASYLSAYNARSRVGGYHYLTSSVTDPNKPAPPRNGAIHIISNILKNVVSSAAEAEIAATFINGQEGCPLIATLAEMGWQQDIVVITTDNSTAEGFCNQTTKQKRTKAIDMRFYWILDRCEQKQYKVIWRPGSSNYADYFTKHHATEHHQVMRKEYQHQNR